MQNLTTTETIIGIDVSKAALDCWLHPVGRAWRCDYPDAALAQLAAELSELQPVRIIVEATGGLETALVAELTAAGLPVVVANPRRVRDFAKATGRLAKTDRLDTALLAQFGAMMRPPARPVPDTARRELRALSARRRQLIAMLTQERNRRRADTPDLVTAQIHAHLALLAEQVAQLDRDIAGRWQDNAVWQARSPTAALQTRRGASLGRHPHRRTARTWSDQPRGSRRSGWRRAVVASGGANAPCGAGAGSCARHCTWPLWQPPDTIRPAAPAMRGSWPPARPSKWPSPRACASS